MSYQTQTTAGDPINVANGNVLHDEVDLSIPNLGFPLEFSLGPEDRMIQSLPFEGPLVVTARVDGDGDAMSRNPGDLQGRLPSPVATGTTGIELVLDERL